MNSGQWERAWRIFNAARELPQDQQRPFVDSECANEPEILERVLALLDDHTEAESRSHETLPNNRTGTEVGRYRVAGLLGRGGVGEVYAARDSDLGRQVALKFLRPESIGDPSAVKRFVREAKAASALNHPNILTIHEVIQSTSGLAIAMELVEGQPLSGLRGTKLAPRQVAEVGSQVAAALAAAHAQSIVHRDIKPENLMLRPDGFVKVLDFGLAHRFGRNEVSALHSSVTGVTGGTLRYMSPEQLHDNPLSGASDVFSLGLVLYELGAGHHPFDSAYAWETAHSIHTRDPQPLCAANPDMPAWLDKLILSMLNRDAALRPAAQAVAAELSRERPQTRKTVLARYRKWLLGAAAVAAATAVVWAVRDRLPFGEPQAVEFTRYPGDEDMPSFSPDGRTVAFAWNGPARDNLDIYTRAIGSTSIERVTTSPLEDLSPAWSPDGSSIAFLRKPRNSGVADILIVPAGGGAERKIASVDMNLFESIGSLAWTPDGKWLIAPARGSRQEQVGMCLISPVDGTQRRITRPPDGQSDVAPAIAPDGRTLAFVRSHSDGVHSIYLLPLTSAYLPAGEPRALPTFANLRLSSPQWTADGKELLFSANPNTGMAIWRIRVPTNGEAPQAPRREIFVGRNFRNRIGPPSAAAHRLMYSTEIQDRSLWRVPLGTPGGSPPLQRLGAPEENNSGVRISPDGSRMVFESMRTGSSEIWLAKIDGTNARALTSFGGPATSSPTWSPDGRRIAFDSRADGRPQVYVVPAEGRRAERITEVLEENYLPSWSRDGKWVYFCSPRTSMVEIWRQPDAGGPAEQVTHGGGWAATESPDGTAVYYQRREAAGWSLRRLTFGTGEDVEILTAISERAFEVTRDGIYYVSAPSLDGRFTIQFYDLRTGGSRLVTPILRPMTSRLALAPDGSFLLYSQLDRWGQDLMLVEGFR